MQQPICSVQGTILPPHILGASDERVRTIAKTRQHKPNFSLSPEERNDSVCLVSIIGEYLICTDAQSPKQTHNYEKFKKWAVLADSCSQIQNQIWPEAV